MIPQTLYSDEKKDLSSDRTIENPFGTPIHVKVDGVFGHWTIHLENGPVPKELNGVFTRYIYAEEKVKAFIKSRQVKEDKPKKIKLPGPRS